MASAILDTIIHDPVRSPVTVLPHDSNTVYVLLIVVSTVASWSECLTDDAVAFGRWVRGCLELGVLLLPELLPGVVGRAGAVRSLVGG